MSVSQSEKQKLLENKTKQSVAMRPHEVLAKPEETDQNEEHEKGKSPLTNVKIEMVNLAPKQNSKNFETKKNQTLLDKALIYRKQNPEIWQRRVKENQQRINESLGIFENCKFLEGYYKALAEANLNKAKLQGQEKNAPGRLSFQLEFNNPRRLSTSKQNNHEIETYGSIAADGLSIFEKKEGSFFDRFRSNKDEERGSDPELLITVLKGRKLNKLLPDVDLMLKECRVKCKIFPDGLKHGPKMKSSYINCNHKGNSKWNHVFVLKGFSINELRTKHVTLEVVGKTNSGKEALVSLVLPGKEANISQTESNSLQTILCGSHHWEEALSKPGKTINVVTELRSTSGQGILSQMMRQELSKTDGDSTRKNSLGMKTSSK